MNKLKEDEGITLIALVITIIVMLILVAVTINMAVNGGLFEYAGQAARGTKEAVENEKQLGKNGITIGNKTYSSIQEFVDEEQIDWESLFLTAKKHPDQQNSEDIGIGTDGKPVNLDLWDYYENRNVIEEDEEPYGLGLSKRTNSIIINGEIQGKVPQYIKKAGETEFKPIVNMSQTFESCSDLVSAPKLPSNVVSLDRTFCHCENLTTAPEIPNGVISLEQTFAFCYSLTTPPSKIPGTVTTMNEAFLHCTSLSIAPMISDGVVNMDNAFSYCEYLTLPPEIPESVTSMRAAFAGCVRLSEVPNIPTTVTDLRETFSGCTGLTVLPKLWERVTEDTTTYIGTPGGQNCFRDCSATATNYDELPYYWGKPNPNASGK